MQFENLLASISPETFERLLQAVEIGRWPDGVKLTTEQLENSIQLVMAYQARFCPSDEPFRIGADGLLVTRSKRDIQKSLQPEATIASFPLNANSDDA